MTERKHTPGPWLWVKPDHWPNHGHGNQSGWLGGFISADGEDIMDFGIDEDYYPTEGEPPTEANARLIAAAPELLEALEIMCNFVEYGSWPDRDPVQTARRAILRAKGETK